MSDANTTLRRSWWPRFTLRVLLLAITAVCIGLGIWTHRARAQKDLVQRIEASGGSVCYECDGPMPAYETGSLRDWLTRLLGRDYFEHVVTVNVSDQKVVQKLGTLRALERVFIEDHGLNDKDLTGLLQQCHNLRRLTIWSEEGFPRGKPMIGSESLLAIAKLPKLEAAHVQGRDFSAAAICEAASLRTLEELEIRGCDAVVCADDFYDLKTEAHPKAFSVWRFDTDGKLQLVAGWSN